MGRRPLLPQQNKGGVALRSGEMVWMIAATTSDVSTTPLGDLLIRVKFLI